MVSSDSEERAQKQNRYNYSGLEGIAHQLCYRAHYKCSVCSGIEIQSLALARSWKAGQDGEMFDTILARAERA